MNTIGQRVRITKLEDLVFNGEHPNGVNEGYAREGIASNDLEVSRSFLIDYRFHTSKVVSVDEINNTFETYNSKYKIEIL